MPTSLKVFSTRLPESVIQSLKLTAVKEHTSVQELVIEALANVRPRLHRLTPAGACLACGAQDPVTKRCPNG